MFGVLFSLLVINGCSPGTKTRKASYQFSGLVTQTSSYCGGARPSEEILEEYNKPKPYVSKVLFVIEGKVNLPGAKVLHKLVTNDSGYFSGQLPPGFYSIIQEQQLVPLDIKSLVDSKPLKADTVCLRKWWKEPLVLMEIKDQDVKGLNINFHHPCFVSGDVPCLRYVGPMPP